jgi:hypothetical protein
MFRQANPRFESNCEYESGPVDSLRLQFSNDSFCGFNLTYGANKICEAIFQKTKPISTNTTNLSSLNELSPYKSLWCSKLSFCAFDFLRPELRQRAFAKRTC